jgi:GTP cyclohydrolase I
MNQRFDPAQLLGAARAPIPDTQSAPDDRHLPIQAVGIRGVRHPATVRLRDGSAQPSVATWRLDVALPADKKGTHMSRMVALLNEHDEPLCAATMRVLARDMLARLGAERGRIEVRFALFIRKAAPVSGVQSLLDYEAGFDVDAGPGDALALHAQVLVPVKSLCPCSKEISDYGAHNQRSHVRIRAALLDDLSFEELIRYAEEEASSEIWGLLKRPDEKFVTESAYDNPKFVEDLVRDVAQRLNADRRIGAYEIEVENFESIHNHSAYARIERAAP